MCSPTLLTSLFLAQAVALGPLNSECPATATSVATDADQLTKALASGQTEVWVSGQIVGDFESLRPGTQAVRLMGCKGATILGSGKGTVLRLSGDDLLVQDIAVSGTGSRVSAEDGAIKVSGKRAVIRRVAVTDALYGIAMERCERCTLEDSTIGGRASIEPNQRGDGVKLWEAHHATVRRNRVVGVRDVVVWYSRFATLEENEIRDGRYGTHFMYAHDSVVRDSRMVNNIVGIFFMYAARVRAENNDLAGASGAAGMGIGFKECDAVMLINNRIVANTSGVYLDFTPRDPRQAVVFEGNLFALNNIAIRTHSSERGAVFRRNDFHENDVLIEVDGNGDALQVVFENNYWAAYAGYDLNRDGTGDVAFQVKRPTSDLRDAYPVLRFFHGTAAMRLYDASAGALPFFVSKLVMQDPSPAMRPFAEVPR